LKGEKNVNKNVKRIHFFTKKLAEAGAVHWTRRTPRIERRLNRLIAYKKAMHEQF
jgi:hypothetical protein